ncbi:MAG: N-methyl-L-tryptophan oxidase [Pseudolabrys sp.]
MDAAQCPPSRRAMLSYNNLMADFDVIVCGLGATGCAALYRLAAAGARVLGLDRYPPGHDRGSSHGLTRVIRQGYFEHPSYVPLVRRAYDLWRDLEAATGRQLLHVSGIAEIGPPDGVLIRGTLESSRLHGLRHEVLDADALMARFPAFRVPREVVGVVQPDGGFLEVEPAIAAFVAQAEIAGAEVRSGETVHAVEPDGAGVRVTTDRGVATARQAIIAAGAWATTLAPGLPLRVTRQVTAWFAPADERPFAAGRFPVFLAESRHGMHYGIPPHGGYGLKVAKHHHGDETVDPDTMDRAVSPADEAMIRDFVADYVPAANGAMTGARTCLYTMTPDGDFIIDRMPGAANIIVASPCSGHGFKFAPAIGEILCGLALEGTTTHDISRFRLSRF